MRTLLFGRSVRRAGGAGAMLGIMAAVGAVVSTASAGTVFTWDPVRGVTMGERRLGRSLPTAIVGTHNLYDVGPIANPSPVTAHREFPRADNGLHAQRYAGRHART